MKLLEELCFVLCENLIQNIVFLYENLIQNIFADNDLTPLRVQGRRKNNNETQANGPKLSQKKIS